MTVGRGAAILCVVVCAAALVPSAAAQPAGEAIVLEGVGAAHGLGMAMDGVVGQARSGWTSDRILSLFYPGTTTGTASGTIRVGLAEGGRQTFVLPEGGTLRPGPGEDPGSGLPLTLAPGSRITLVSREGRPAIEGDRPVAEPKADEAPPEEPVVSARAALAVRAPITPPPILEPTPEPPDASPTPPPAPVGADAAAPVSPASLRLVPDGDPALVLVESTGKRYRGEIEVSDAGGTLRVVNHVDLETYVEGIAEARGAGWPLEAMKALAVAARTLGAATMTWYHKSRAGGYDICPTQNCQVYLGYDGEEGIMRRAAAETRGRVLEYDGTPILAMYHGNGGGQTESYHRVAGIERNPHPYLTSVRYPHASPSSWRRELTMRQIETSLVSAGVSVPRPVHRIEVVERGDSPRVTRLRVHGRDGHEDIRGAVFADALELWSTWFRIQTPVTARAGALGAASSSRPFDRQGVPVDPGGTWILAFAAAVAALVTAGALRTTADRMPSLRLGWPRPRAAPAPSRPGS